MRLFSRRAHCRTMTAEVVDLVCSDHVVLCMECDLQHVAENPDADAV